MKKLSVIIPVYNTGNLLIKAVESVQNQTLNNIEVLLIDDGSSDGTEKICDELAEKYENVCVYHKKNGGVSSARNLGLDKSNGEYIAFLDADDYVDADLYENALKSIGSNDMIFFNYSMDENQKIYKVHQATLKKLCENPKDFMLFYGQNNRKFVSQDFCEDTVLSVFSVRIIYRKSFIDKNNLKFDIRIKSGEDRIFIFNALLKTDNITYCDGLYGYYYFIRGVESLTGNKSKQEYREGIFERYELFDKVEQEICRKNNFLNEDNFLEIRLERAKKMRIEVITNEFKYNKKNAIKNIREYKKSEFFKFAYNWSNLRYILTHSSKNELIKFIVIKFRLYKLLLLIYR